MPGGSAEVEALFAVSSGVVKEAIFCFFPLSSITKSSGFKSLMASPFLSVTTTSTNTMRVFTRIVGTGIPVAACCAQNRTTLAPHVSTIKNTRKERGGALNIVISPPWPRGYGSRAETATKQDETVSLLGSGFNAFGLRVRRKKEECPIASQLVLIDENGTNPTRGPG